MYFTVNQEKAQTLSCRAKAFNDLEEIHHERSFILRQAGSFQFQENKGKGGPISPTYTLHPAIVRRLDALQRIGPKLSPNKAGQIAGQETGNHFHAYLRMPVSRVFSSWSKASR
jgi:hypothetical protein